MNGESRVTIQTLLLLLLRHFSRVRLCGQAGSLPHGPSVNPNPSLYLQVSFLFSLPFSFPFSPLCSQFSRPTPGSPTATVSSLKLRKDQSPILEELTALVHRSPLPQPPSVCLKYRRKGGRSKGNCLTVNCEGLRTGGSRA